MKLKDGFTSHDIDDTRFLVPVGGAAFQGFARGNKTAARIIDLLQTETTEAEIVDALYAQFDAPRERIAGDVKGILSVLRQMDAIEE